MSAGDELEFKIEAGGQKPPLVISFNYHNKVDKNILMQACLDKQFNGPIELQLKCPNEILIRGDCMQYDN